MRCMTWRTMSGRAYQGGWDGHAAPAGCRLVVVRPRLHKMNSSGSCGSGGGGGGGRPRGCRRCRALPFAGEAVLFPHEVEPGRYCSPRLLKPRKPRNEGSNACR